MMSRIAPRLSVLLRAIFENLIYAVLYGTVQSCEGPALEVGDCKIVLPGAARLLGVMTYDAMPSFDLILFLSSV